MLCKVKTWLSNDFSSRLVDQSFPSVINIPIKYFIYGGDNIKQMGLDMQNSIHIMETFNYRINNKLFLPHGTNPCCHLKCEDFAIKFPYSECASKILCNAFKDKYHVGEVKMVTIT